MKKNIILIEGPDNTGKDTLIKNMQNVLGDNVLYHFTAPPNTIPKVEKLDYQYNEWLNIYNNTMKSMSIGRINYAIWNRSHLSEYVYGSMYRNIPEEVILKKIVQFEDNVLKTFFDTYNFHLVILVPNADTVIKNDDGLSHSIDKQDKINEIKKFKELKEITLIKNTIIYNVCQPDGNFKNPKTIKDEILNRLDINS